MQELLNDPETLSFIKGRDLSLGILKKQIDRRFLKIKNMLGKNQGALIKRVQTIDEATQTQNSQSCQSSTVLLSLDFMPVLMDHNVNLEHSDEQNLKNTLPRSGLQKYQLHRQQSLQNISENDSIKQKPEYMSAKKASKNTFFTSNLVSGRPSFQSNISSKRPPLIYRQKDDKPKSNLKLKSDKRNENYDNMISPCFYIDLNNNNHDNACESVIQYCGNQERQERPSLCTKGKQTSSRRNLKITDRTSLPQPQKRISVTDECQMKMMNLIWQIIPQKRRENIDTNLRYNVIRKIDEKYGDYFDNM